MEKKEYQVGVTIIEGRNFVGKDAAGTSDPFVKITVANLDPQVTKKHYGANSCVWNQQFTFPKLMMNQYELETFEIIVEAYDHNPVYANEMIGSYSIGLSTLYRSLNHEFYKCWLTLYNHEDSPDVQGYLLVNCFIVGPGERPPGHIDDADFGDESEEDDENMTEAQRIKMKEQRKGVFLLNEPSINKKGYQLSVNVLKAESLPPMDSSGNCNSFISVRSVGQVMTTPVIDENLSPTYSNKLQFPVFMPILNDKITIRVWHRGGRFSDQFIANIPEYPSHFDYFNLSKLLSMDGKMKCSWINTYGVHPADRSYFKQVNSAKKEGTSFLGRVLIQMTLTPNDKPALARSIAHHPKEPTNGKFQLWVDSYDLVKADVPAGYMVWMIATVGSYQSSKFYAKYRDTTKSYSWAKISLKELKVNYPVDMQ